MSQSSSPEGQEQPFLSHLFELRDRLLRIVLSVIVLFIILAPFAPELYSALARPMVENLAPGASFIATKPTGLFLAPYKLALVLAVYLSIPWVLYQFWAFVAPGLYRHEKRLVYPLLISSTLLFYLGMVFAYFVVFPLVFGFLTSSGPADVVATPDISFYLDFVLTLFFAFGVAFEVPIATILLVWTGMVKPDTLREKRPYVVVGAFIIGMFLTPPDVISQTLLALPMWALYEIGILFSAWFIKPTSDEIDLESDPVADNQNTITDQSYADDSNYEPLSDAEMEAELDAADEDDDDEDIDDEHDKTPGLKDQDSTGKNA